MANLPESDSFDAGVYQLETTDPALGGANGVMNTPPKSLTNRTRYLLNRILDGVLSFVNDSGAANAIVASFPQPVAALVDGMEVSFRVGFANTTATTLKLTNAGGPTLPTLPLYGGDHVALAGAEFPAGAVVRAKLNTSLNSSNGGAWVVMAVTGGYARAMTPTVGDVSTKVANMAAVNAATDGMATVSVSTGSDVTLSATQYGNAILKLTGTPTAAINLILPAGQTGQWIIVNNQGGTNNITVKPSGGTGVVLPQGSTATVVYSDGSAAAFASSQASQSAFSAIPITGITGTSLTVSGGYTPGSIFIEKNGSLLEPADFSATASPNITLTKAAVSTDVFTVYRFVSFTVANAVQKSGDVLAGPLQLFGGDTIASDPAAADSSGKVASTRWVGANTHGRTLRTTVYYLNGGTLYASIDGAAGAPASSTFTPLAATNSVEVEGCGGGGAGGGSIATSSTQSSSGSGGCSGSWARARYLSGFSGVTVAIGAGGAGVAGGNGSNGGQTSFGALLVLPGGGGGATLTGTVGSTNAIGTGGAPVGAPSGSGIMFSTGGVSGGTASVLTGGTLAGAGSSTPYGAGARPTASIGAGIAGGGFGAGGSGGYSAPSNAAAAGGAGSGGCLIVRELA